MIRRRGFTFIEMCLGIVITAMVAIAVSSFTLAVTKHWSQTNQQQLLQNTGEQSIGAIGATIESARALGSVLHTNGEQIFIWQSDSYGGVADGKVQLCEMALIEYQPALSSIVYYQPDLSLNLTADTSAGLVLTSNDMVNASVITLFKQQTQWLKAARPLLGPGRSVTSSTSATTVTAARFNSVAGTVRAGVTIDVTIARDGRSYTLSSRAGVRGPQSIPSTTTETPSNTVGGVLTALLRAI